MRNLLGSVAFRAGTAAAGLAAVLAASPAPGADRGDYTMEILLGGAAVAEYAARGTRYVEAADGREYAVRLANRSDRRVAVALSVDGLNSIDARTTTAREGRKWILGPHESITLQGWQTGRDTARRFYFTRESRSYGAWLGRTGNLGIVSAAFFRERLPQPIAELPDRDASAPATPRAEAQGARSKAAAPSDSYAATGIGGQVDHRVVEVPFDAEPTPAAVIDLRYEFHDALVRLGVLPPAEEPLARRQRARGFSDDGFAPDPYARGD